MLGQAHGHDLDADAAKHGLVFGEGSLDAKDSDLHRWRSAALVAYQPRTARRSSSGTLAALMPRMGAPRPLETSAMILGSSKCVVACTMALAVVAGSSDLKMPEPTKTPSAPSCMARAASDGVAMPPATKLTTGRRPAAATSLTIS